MESRDLPALRFNARREPSSRELAAGCKVRCKPARNKTGYSRLGNAMLAARRSSTDTRRASSPSIKRPPTTSAG